MNVEAAFTIRFGQGSVNGSGVFNNLNKIESSDLTYMVFVKVVNQIEQDTTLSKFYPIPGMKPANFSKIYSDSFISGFQSGGGFLAIISIRAKDRNQVNAIKAQAAADLTLDKASVSVNGDFIKDQHDILTENETTITVTWTGGGQYLKKPEVDWTFDTMRAAALAFPDPVAKCPMRIHAVQTRYTALKSFHTAGAQFSPLSYEGARVYTTALQDAFLDYQNISKNLQVLAFDVTTGSQRLVVAGTKIEKDFGQKTLKASDPKLGKTESGTTNKHSTGAGEKTTPPKPLDPLAIDTPYPATVFGLEAARMQCRFMMNRFVAEVDIIAQHSEIASDETRPLPYMSPFLFHQLLPVGVHVGL